MDDLRPQESTGTATSHPNSFSQNGYEFRSTYFALDLYATSRDRLLRGKLQDRQLWCSGGGTTATGPARLIKGHLGIIHKRVFRG